jgi:hypothetical protein
MGLAACGQEPSEACASYVAAADTCFTAAENAGLDVDVEQTPVDAFCLDLFPDVSDAQWTCETQAYQSGDCTTDAGLAEVTAAREACGE